jgi:hypothetical protein
MDKKPIGTVSSRVVQELAQEIGLSFFEAERLAKTQLGVGELLVVDDPAVNEKADLVVCGLLQLPLPTGSVVASCASCGTPIMHRDHAPKAPIKVCVPCAQRRMLP